MNEIFRQLNLFVLLLGRLVEGKKVSLDLLLLCLAQFVVHGLVGRTQFVRSFCDDGQRVGN